MPGESRMADYQLDELQIKIGADTKAAEEGIKHLTDVLKNASTVATSSAGSLRAFASAVTEMGKNAHEAGEETETSNDAVSSSFARVIEYAKKAASTVARGIGKGVTSVFHGLSNVVGNVFGKISTLFSAIKRIAFYRMIRTAIKGVTQALKEGVQMLVLWDRTYGNNTSKAAKTTDEIAAKWREVKKSLGAAAMPIIQLVQPALERIMQSVISIANLINQTVRSLQGYSTYIKATDKGFKSAVKNAKELKRILFGFDELNVLPSANGGASDEQISAIDFEEVDIEKTINLDAFRRVGQLFTDVKNRFAEFKSEIQGGGSIVGATLDLLIGLVQDFGMFFADVFRGAGGIINGFVEELGVQGTAIGQIIEGIGNAFIHFGDLIEGIVTLNFPMITTAISNLFTDFLNIVDGILWEIGNLINKGLTWLEQELGIDFDSIRTVVGFLMTAIRTIVGVGLPAILKIFFDWGGTLLKLFEDIFDGIAQVFGGIIDFITGIFSGDWKMAWGGIVDIFKGIANTILGIIEAMLNAVGALPRSVIDAINKFKIKVPDWVPLIGGKEWNPQINWSVPRITIPKFAEGGFMPNTGSLFYSGEAGAELVANMRGGTGVMNIEQFENAMTNANTEVVNAVYAMANMVAAAINNKNFDVNLDGRKIGQSVTQYQRNYARQYGG